MELLADASQPLEPGVGGKTAIHRRRSRHLPIRRLSDFAGPAPADDVIRPGHGFDDVEYCLKVPPDVVGPVLVVNHPVVDGVREGAPFSVINGFQVPILDEGPVGDAGRRFEEPAGVTTLQHRPQERVVRQRLHFGARGLAARAVRAEHVQVERDGELRVGFDL
ncbi:hypothetical protein ACTMTI_45830 [Nonomuraea sp. H19]|uniref:hypothetical protein n=1 Tax=Nonomuraea sp. H19 TaxID=3452206 RepID=UPI003F8B00AB